MVKKQKVQIIVHCSEYEKRQRVFEKLDLLNINFL